MSWYEAAAWGCLGGFAMQVWEALLWVRFRARAAVPWRFYIDFPAQVIVAIIRALLGALVGIAFGFDRALPIYGLIFAGFVSVFLLSQLGSLVVLVTSRSRQVKSEAKRLDSARNATPALAGVSEDLVDILEERRAALADQLPEAKPPREGGRR